MKKIKEFLETEVRISASLADSIGGFGALMVVLSLFDFLFERLGLINYILFGLGILGTNFGITRLLFLIYTNTSKDKR